MEKWKEICGREAGRLKEALELAKHADALVNHGGVRGWIADEDERVLRETRRKIAEKERRLQKGEFHIAVVGVEKTGKSSFINAWIGEDLLPNKQKRCTFTTTRLHSVMDENEQRLEITTKTAADFAKDVADLEKLAKSDIDDVAAKARADLELIHANRERLTSLLDRRIEPVYFNSLDEIAGDLEKYAADGSYAHAIAAVDLYTKSLAEMDGILFYDVPGIDSGLEKHKEETKRMLEDSDAVIIVKRSDQPDLKGPESDILRYAKAGDDSVPVRDKVFFFVSRIDDQKTREGYLKNREDFLELCRESNIDEDKVVFGAAAVSLLLDDKLKDRDFIQPPDELKRHLRNLLDLPDEEDETVKNAAGVEELKRRMDKYLRTEREAILRSSCDRLIGELETRARNIRDAVRARTPDDPARTRENFDERVIMMFNEWFGEFWREVQAKISKDQAGELVDDSLRVMEDDYVEKARESVANLKYYDPAKREEFFDALNLRGGGDDLENMNATIRKEINEEVLHRLQDLSARLSSNLYENLMKYMERLSAYFNGGINLRTMLLTKMGAWPEEYYRRQLESVLGALYLRYARPLATGLMRYRRGLPARIAEARKHKNTFIALSNCYPDDQPDEFASLTRYIGGSPRADETKGAGAEILKKIRGDAEAAPEAGAPKLDDDAYGAKKPVYASREDVADELERDRRALEAYLTGAVFACSGIGEYAESEIDRIRRVFVELEDRIRGAVHNQYNYRNPKLLEIMPRELVEAECDTRVAELLDQLTRALRARP